VSVFLVGGRKVRLIMVRKGSRILGMPYCVDGAGHSAPFRSHEVATAYIFRLVSYSHMPCHRSVAEVFLGTVCLKRLERIQHVLNHLLTTTVLVEILN